MQRYPILSQILPPALLPVDENHSVSHLQPRRTQWGSGFEHRGTAGHEVFNDEAGLIGIEGALDDLGGSVVFYLLAAHDHGNSGGDGDGGGDGQGSVGDAANNVVVGGGRNGGDKGLGDLTEEIRVGDDEAEINVDRGGDAGLELEGAELDGGDFMELQDERLHR